MDLDKVKSDIDALLEKHKENWMNFIFMEDQEMCESFKDRQIYKAMYAMSVINATCYGVDDPEVFTQQEGYDFQFKWTFEDQYYLSLNLVVPWEGRMSWEINTFEEGDPDGPMQYGDWDYKRFHRADDKEVHDFAEKLKLAMETKNETRVAKETS